MRSRLNLIAVLTEPTHRDTIAQYKRAIHGVRVVRICSSPDEAYQFLKLGSKEVDVVLMDTYYYKLPAESLLKSGDELAREIRTLCPECKLIAISEQYYAPVKGRNELFHGIIDRSEFIIPVTIGLRVAECLQRRS